ncbi:hypothetical protein JCGZ_05038 [Jatropha curcas]|uniref:DUF7036 domain-containing protein n=1 Tax=Jatropha curcas TaxID=180498 RepID=A0A067KRP0_JATCU|nr:uncharacterized protein LOC105633371 [Jatropha curcas]KDP38881.1 hypothetical protein JCGZ_05038 [Jatropha curcas]
MGKEAQQNLQQWQSYENGNGGGREGGSSGIFCERCSMGLSRIYKDFSFRCFFVLILSLSLLVSGIFWILPSHTAKLDGFDAKDSIKFSAAVQVYFRLQKPVSQVVQHIDRLEYDINDEIGVPGAKVAVLSMHQSGASNWTEVVFGVLSNSIQVPINQVSLSVLRSSLIEVFLRESNLTLTTSIFGQPSMFQILKFSGGITVIPVAYASIWQRPQILFKFTLNNSIAEILYNLAELRNQLKFGLHLRPYENVIVQITNTAGSTIDSPVTVQASVVSDLGSLLPLRLRQLAQTITDSPSKNLGLDNSVFGKVKSVILSSYLKETLHANPPTPSPAPSPELNDYSEPPTSPCPTISPSISPAASPTTSPKSGPDNSLSPVNSPVHSTVTAEPPQPCGYHGSPVSPSPSPSRSNLSPYLHPADPPSQLPPDMSPSPQASFNNPRKGSVAQLLAPSPSALSPTSVAAKPFYRELSWLGFSGVLIFYLFCWQY